MDILMHGQSSTMPFSQLLEIPFVFRGSDIDRDLEDTKLRFHDSMDLLNAIRHEVIN
jgi:hypothetical protein